jgi:ferrous iron transport protein A
MNTSFANLRPGDRACVSGFSGLPGAYRNRLLSLGLTPGTEFIVKRVAPLGDPIEIVVRGFRLSLRREEAAGLMVERR